MSHVHSWVSRGQIPLFDRSVSRYPAYHYIRQHIRTSRMFRSRLKYTVKPFTRTWPFVCAGAFREWAIFIKLYRHSFSCCQVAGQWRPVEEPISVQCNKLVYFECVHRCRTAEFLANKDTFNTMILKLQKIVNSKFKFQTHVDAANI